MALFFSYPVPVLAYAEAPQSLLFTAEVEVFNPNLLGGESEEGQVWLTYNGQRMGTGKMEPSKVSSQATAEIVTEMNLDLPLDFVPFRLSQELVWTVKGWQLVQRAQYCRLTIRKILVPFGGLVKWYQLKLNEVGTIYVAYYFRLFSHAW